MVAPRAQRWTAIVAAIFGVVTLVAGGRVLFGFGESGYTVVRPVLIFNVAMGSVYLAAAALIVRDLARGRWLATAIALLNVVVLIAIVVLRATGVDVANETLAAMTLRAAVWIVIAVVLRRALRLQRPA